MFITPSCLAISRKSDGALLSRCVDVREMTFRSATLASRVRISSWTPSAKKALSGSRLRLSKGNTAMLFAGIVVAAEIDRLGGAGETVTIFCREKNQAAAATISRTRKATAASVNLATRRAAARGGPAD